MHGLISNTYYETYLKPNPKSNKSNMTYIPNFWHLCKFN